MELDLFFVVELFDSEPDEPQRIKELRSGPYLRNEIALAHARWGDAILCLRFDGEVRAISEIR
jgi:hypothetical protein